MSGEKARGRGGTLVVGRGPDVTQLVVFDFEEAVVLAKAWGAVRLDELYEAMKALPEPYYSHVNDLIIEAAIRGEVFTIDRLRQWAIEGGLESPTQHMVTVLPSPVIARFAELSFPDDTRIGLSIDRQHRSILIEHLSGLGYQVIEDDALTAAASGASE